MVFNFLHITTFVILCHLSDTIFQTEGYNKLHHTWIWQGKVNEITQFGKFKVTNIISQWYVSNVFHLSDHLRQIFKCYTNTQLNIIYIYEKGYVLGLQSHRRLFLSHVCTNPNHLGLHAAAAHPLTFTSIYTHLL